MDPIFETRLEISEITVQQQELRFAWLLWERRRTLLRATLAGLVLSTLVAFLIPPRYRSAARLMPPSNDSFSTFAMLAAAGGRTGDAAIGSYASELLGVRTPGSLFVGVLQSRTLQDRLIDRFQLMEVYSESRRVDARKELIRSTEIMEDRRTGIISVNVLDRSRERARDLAQAYVDELNVLVAQLSTSAARREREFIEQRLEVVKKELDTSAAELSAFSSQHAAIDIKEQGRAMLEALATLQGKMMAAQAELKGLEQIYTSNNVRVRSVRARISELERQIRHLGGVPPELGQTPSIQTYPSIRELPVLGVKWSDLYRRTKINEVVFETLSKQHEIAKVQEAKEIPTVRVLDPADLPERKAYPRRWLIIFLGTFVAFGFTVLWVVTDEFWGRLDAADPRKHLVLEIAAASQSSLSAGSRKVRNWWRSRVRRDKDGLDQLSQ